MAMQADPASVISERQRAWARQRGIHLIGSKGDRGARAYTATLEENLFEPLSAEAQAEYAAGDGSELGQESGDPGKMQALHSSSALCCNVFHYWRRLGRLDMIAKACDLPTDAQAISFEKHLEIDAAQFRRAPNLDAVLNYTDHLVAIESKFCEPFSSRPHNLLSTAYVAASCDPFWASLANLRALAEKLTVKDSFVQLDAAQLLKHILWVCENRAARHRRYCISTTRCRDRRVQHTMPKSRDSSTPPPVTPSAYLQRHIRK